MGLASFNRMRLRLKRNEEMAPENIEKREKEIVVNKPENEEAKEPEVKRGSKRK